MPVARILTRYPEQAGALSEELRLHGYTVEFSSPDLTGKPPADLEIDFELCSEDDALSRASELAESFHADVAVSPGVLEILRRADAPLAPQVEDAHDVASATNLAVDETAPIEAMIEDRIEQTGPITETSQAEISLPPNMLEHATEQPEIPKAEAGQVFDRAPFEHAWDEAAWHGEQEPVAAEEPVKRANGAWEDELNIARAAGDTREIHPEKDRFAEARERSAAALKSAAVAGSELWARTKDFSQGFWASLKQVTAEYREGLQVRRAEMKADREHKLLELEKRKALAEERAAELETAREAAALRLHQLLLERGGLTEAQPAPPEKTVAPPAPVNAERRTLWASKIRIPLTRAYRPQLEAVLMGVAAACSLFVLGLAVASFHARPAISSSVKQPANEGVTLPPKGVTLQAGGVTLKPANATTLPNATAPKPSAVSRVQPAKPAPGQSSGQSSHFGSDVTIRHVGPAKPSAQTSGGSDVVIRHFGAQPKPAQSPAQAGLKHISDLDN